MQPDITELLDFYERPLGAVVRRTLALQIRERWSDVRGGTLIGVGFATPYMAAFRGEAERIGALMPGFQGAVVWPPAGPVNTVAVEEHQLPLPDNSVDYLLAVHCLEASENARILLREIWRVIRPEGRLILVVPNRRGIWARVETTPFGHGRPYSSGQLEKLLAEAMFTPLGWDSALYIPPVDRRMILGWAGAVDTVGRHIWPAFAGLVLVEARKELVSPIGTPALAPRLRALIPQRGLSAAARDAAASPTDQQKS